MYTNEHSIKILNSFPIINNVGFNQSEYCRQFNNSTLIVNASSKSVRYDPHGGVLSIKCVLQGNEHYQIGNYKYSVCDRNYLVVNRDTIRSSYIDSNTAVKSFTISFAPNLEYEVLSSLLNDPQLQMDSPFTIRKEAFSFAEKLYSHENDSHVTPYLKILYQNLSSLNNHELQHLVVNILEGLYLSQKAVLKEIESMRFVKASTRIEIYSRLCKAQDYIWSNFKDDLTLHDIADIASMNSYYFLREYKRLFKTTPHKFLQKLRMDEARQLLSGGQTSVSEACRAVGFSDVSSFSKLFKKMYSMNPSEIGRS